MSKIAALVVAVVMFALLAAVSSAQPGPAYTLTFVSANGPPIPGAGNELGETAYFTVRRTGRWLNKPNLYQRVTLVTSCNPATNIVGSLRPGSTTWVSLESRSLYGDYWGTNCKAWASLDWTKSIDSNVVSFVG